MFTKQWRLTFVSLVTFRDFVSSPSAGLTQSLMERSPAGAGRNWAQSAPRCRKAFQASMSSRPIRCTKREAEEFPPPQTDSYNDEGLALARAARRA